MLVLLTFSCQEDNGYVPLDDDDQIQESPVNFDINLVPYPTLSEYNFFDGTISDLNPVYGVLPYDLITPLFSDYAKKKRFIWMPNGVSANYVDDHSSLDFPTGTILIKNFYYDNVLPSNSTKIIETRLMIKKDEGWIFANYKWNDEQTEADFDINGSNVNIQWNELGQTKNVTYRVPSEAECITCHKSLNTGFTTIGPKPQNLNRTLVYNEGSKNQLQKWVETGYLNNDYPEAIQTVVDWNDASQDLDLRIRSYLDINCAHCHSEGTYCFYRPLRLSYNETYDYNNIGVCVPPDDMYDSTMGLIVTPSNVYRSVLYDRLNTAEVNKRMPLLSRTLIHEEAVILIENWINSLTDSCQ